MKEICDWHCEPSSQLVMVDAMVSFEGLPEMTYFVCSWCFFLSSNVCSDLRVYFIAGLY
jgi:hypothetical protein